MLIRFVRSALLGERVYNPRETAEVADAVARRELKSGRATLAAEDASSPPPPENASAAPRRGRKA